MDPESLVLEAMEAMNRGDMDTARERLRAAVDGAGERPDLLHALGALELQRGAPGEARPLVERALALLDTAPVDEAAAMRAHFRLTLASIAEAEDRPAEAQAAYHAVLGAEPQHFEALVGLGRLQLAWGELDRGLATLTAARAAGHLQRREDLDELRAFTAAVEAFRASGRGPRELIEVHREAYCGFFDHHAGRMAEQGWIAEAARMRRGPDGVLVPDIPAGARPYAAMRIDLVDPSTGQGGQVGDRPMLVAVPGFEPLSRGPVLLPWTGLPFSAFVSSQCPWEHLPLQLMLVEGDPLEVLDPAVGAWYRAGFDGRFGTREAGRFHFVSEPEPRAPAGLVYTLDLGRARIEAIDALLESLTAVHARHPLRRVILGRGHLPI
ncbi:MAG: hypothetical protein ABIO70_03005 [Pseudomonadota bacterium]